MTAEHDPRWKGDSHPRQEGPLDLRLVPPALAAWATAALVLDVPLEWSLGVAGACLVAGVTLLRGQVRLRLGWQRTPVAAVLLCVAASAVSAGLHGADVRRGPVPEAARRFGTVVAEVELTGDPWLSKPRVRGDHAAPVGVLARGEVRWVGEEGVGGGEGALLTRSPVLLVVDADVPAPGVPGVPGGGAEAPDADVLAPGAHDGGAAARAGWLRLLPSTRLRLTGRLAPPTTAGDRTAAVLRVRSWPPPEAVSGPTPPQRLAGRLRAGLREATEEIPSDARALLPGLVVGDTSRITPDLDDAFKATDLAHTLAVSGSNLTILLALLIGPPGMAGLAERRGVAPVLGLSLRTTALLAGALTVAFVIVCRPDPSVLRAAACGAVALLALATGRRRSLLPALATAVLLLVLYDPWLSRSYGFVLSVLATGALLLLAPHWSEALLRRGVPARLAEGLAAAAAAQAACAPVVAVLSARVSLVAVPCNLLVELAVAPATVLGFAALAAAPASMPLAKALAWCAGWPAGWIATVARTGAAQPGAGVDWPGSWPGALLLAAVTVALVLAGRRLIRHPWWCGALALLLLLAVVRPAPLTRAVTGWPPRDWRYAMCDVGQGDATVLSTGPGAAVVVDAGPDPAPVDRCLRELGITRIPLVVLTHFHADHVGGLTGVLRGRSVAAIETTAFEEPTDQFESVRREAATHHIPLTTAAAGEERRVGPLTWRVLWPQADSPIPPDGPNDASITLLVHTAGLRLLLLGDLEPPAQRELLRTPEASDLARVDVLKVAHHGSAYQDPDLLRLTAPRVALISCGTDNPYGHPAPTTLSALRSGGATVLRTDRDGALALTGTGGPHGGMKVMRD
ncbi:ComEC/Rec2 family competence protein [Streptomyces sp. NPDC048202]|uniref:ComEC/Rec2 family competence protein n=1 Tax=Streptomyces sp. NPDC048202 TaxID=3365514 RepID=UPI00371E705D